MELMLEEEEFQEDSEDCEAKPDTVCFDPDDRTAWGLFEADSFRFPEQDICYNVCGRGGYGDPVFELYSITLNKLDPKRDFSLIYLDSDATGKQPFIIYKRPKGKDIEYNKPLPLRIPLLTSTPLKSVVISFTNKRSFMERWSFGYSGSFNICNCMCRCKYKCKCIFKCKCSPVVILECEDEHGTSVATVSYRIIKIAAWAKLTIRIIEKEDRDIYVTYGAITATDGEDCRTKRIIQQYPKEEGPVCLPSRKDLEVYRCVFGVPKGTYLRVEVELAYFVSGSPDEEKKIQGSLDFKVPIGTWVDLFSLRTPGAILAVQTEWKIPHARFC